MASAWRADGRGVSLELERTVWKILDSPSEGDSVWMLRERMDSRDISEKKVGRTWDQK